MCIITTKKVIITNTEELGIDIDEVAKLIYVLKVIG
jgi:hypothetical protein